MRKDAKEVLQEAYEKANGNRILPQATTAKERVRFGGQFVLTLHPPPLRLQPLEFRHCTAVSADRGEPNR